MKIKIMSKSENLPRCARARYIMIGGFLGAGKTTAVAKLAQHLTGEGLRVGLITNDQGNELVDTVMLRAKGFATEEIPGGCFCCRFNSLVDAANKLAAEARPDVFIAEPVGSCTDLVATVTYPLRRMYGENFSVAPLSVLVDPIRALRMFGLAEGGRFSEKVMYIYRKQLEEADLIVINKRDLLDKAQSAVLHKKLTDEYPRAEIHAASARSGDGLESWFAQITSTDQRAGKAMEVDYEVYAEGEARLGWLNCTVQISSGEEFDGNATLRALAGRIQELLNAEHVEVAHLKMTLSPDEGLGDIAVINLVRNDFVPELSQELPDAILSGQVIINCRAEAAPETLLTALKQGLDDVARELSGVTLLLEHSEHFRPSKPEPTHRIANLTT
jgi:G3E family GTPase